MSESVVTGLVRIVHGPHSLDHPLHGHTVADARRRYQARFNIASDATALVEGVKVGDSTVLEPGDVLEFIHEQGRKGIGEVYTEEEFIQKMRITREVFEDWVREGLPVHRMSDGTLRITETQADQFFDRRAGLMFHAGYQPGDPSPDLLTEEEAIRYLRLDQIDIKNPEETLRRYRKEGHLRGTQVSKRVFYLRSELDDLLRKLTKINPR